MTVAQKNACGTPDCPCRLRSPEQVEKFLNRIRRRFSVDTYEELGDILFHLMSRPPRDVPVELNLTQPEIQALITHLDKVGYEQVVEALNPKQPHKWRQAILLAAAAAAIVAALTIYLL